MAASQAVSLRETHRLDEPFTDVVLDPVSHGLMLVMAHSERRKT